jgi:hypothetical protein
VILVCANRAAGDEDSDNGDMNSWGKVMFHRIELLSRRNCRVFVLD